jgi:hypothetical protein
MIIMSKKGEKICGISIIIIILMVIIFIFSYFFISKSPELKSVKVEIDHEKGVGLNFSKLNLNEEAIENITKSDFLIIIDFPRFHIKKTYLYSPDLSGTKHPITQNSGSIKIDNVNKYESERDYPFHIHFVIESYNDELKDLTLLNNTNSIYGSIRFDLSSYDVDIFDNEDYIHRIDESNYEIVYEPHELKLKINITKN